jgi:hypothetical protein
MCVLMAQHLSSILLTLNTVVLILPLRKTISCREKNDKMRDDLKISDCISKKEVGKACKVPNVNNRL